MQPLVQSAIDAANRGENNKALELLKQALTANPNDVDAWLVVAAVVEQPERKRQCLNRVLSLDPTNQIARDELLEMDRIAMGGVPAADPEPSADALQGTPLPAQPTYPSTPPLSNDPTGTYAFESDPVSEPAYPSSAFSDYPASTSAFESVPAVEEPAPRPASKTRTEKPLVFRYPLFWRVFMYIFLVFFGCVGLYIATQNVVNSLPFFGMALIAGVVAMMYSPKVEVTEAGIRASSIFSSSEVKWSEIKSMKAAGMKQRLELVKGNGQVIKVSNQVSGYPRIVEILRRKRPDLFGMAASSPSGQGNAFTSAGYEQSPSSSYGSSVPAPFSGTQKFGKNFFAQYGLYFLAVPFCLYAAWAAFTQPENRTGALIGVLLCVVLMILPLFQVNGIKVEANKLTIETLFARKVFSARQIKDIKMDSVRGRYGRVTNFVNIIPIQGKNYPLAGFSAGEEIIYGFLTNWWNAYRNR